MAITVRGYTSGTQASGTSLTVTLPTGFATNDVAIIHISARSATAPTAASGWTLVTGTNSVLSGVYGTYCYSRVLQAGDANPVFTVASALTAWECAAYIGVNTATPTDGAAVQQNATNSTTATSPSISPTGSTDELLMLYTGDLNETYSAASLGVIEKQTNVTDGTHFVTGCLVDALLAASGATGAQTVTQSTNGTSIGTQIALLAASGGTVYNNTATGALGAGGATPTTAMTMPNAVTAALSALGSTPSPNLVISESVSGAFLAGGAALSPSLTIPESVTAALAGQAASSASAEVFAPIVTAALAANGASAATQQIFVDALTAALGSLNTAGTPDLVISEAVTATLGAGGATVTPNLAIAQAALAALANQGASATDSLTAVEIVTAALSALAGQGAVQAVFAESLIAAVGALGGVATYSGETPVVAAAQALVSMRKHHLGLLGISE